MRRPYPLRTAPVSWSDEDEPLSRAVGGTKEEDDPKGGMGWTGWLALAKGQGAFLLFLAFGFSFKNFLFFVLVSKIL